MADLLTTRELALWTQKDPGEVAVDDFAREVIDKVSGMARFLSGHDGTQLDADGEVIPEWTLDAGVNKIPYDAQIVVLQVAKRAYENPGQVVQEGGIGPIGGDRVLDAAAMLLSLSEAETAVLTRYNVNGDPTGGSSEVFVLPTTRGTETIAKSATLYVTDDQQVGMTPDESAYPDWMIPMFSPGDPGDPNLYEDA